MDSYALMPGIQAVMNAVENAAVDPVEPCQILAILRGGSGNPSHVRAIFGDVSFPILAKLAGSASIGIDTMLSAYREARIQDAAANAELDAMILERRDGPSRQGC